MNLAPRLPIITDPNISTAYVSISASDVIYSTFETHRILSKTGTELSSSVCSLTANNIGNSGHFQVVRLLLYNNGFEPSFSGLTSGIGIYTLRKRKFDTDIRPGTLTATVQGAQHQGDYYDSGSGQLIQKSTGNTVGAVLNDDGMIVVTSTLTSIVSSITSINYKSTVLNTSLNVYCKCYPGQLNFTLNPTAFQANSVNDWMKEPFTASTSASVYRTDFTSSGIDWQPLITGIGLYSDNNDLLAVAKLSSPLRKPTDIPLTLHFSLDL
jgi:hypothetical protein